MPCRAGDELTLDYGFRYDAHMLSGYGFLPDEPTGAALFNSVAELAMKYAGAAGSNALEGIWKHQMSADMLNNDDNE